MSVKGIDINARWFAGKGRPVEDVAPAGGLPGLGIVEVRYADGSAERYLDLAPDLDWAALLRGAFPVAGDGGRLELAPGPALAGLLAGGDGAREPSTDQSNTLVVLGERLLVKAYRRLEPGPHPEVELLTALGGTDAPVPPFAGSLRWVPDDGGPATAIALLQGFVAGLEDGWEAPIERVAAGPGARRGGPDRARRGRGGGGAAVPDRRVGGGRGGRGAGRCGARGRVRPLPRDSRRPGGLAGRRRGRVGRGGVAGRRARGRGGG